MSYGNITLTLTNLTATGDETATYGEDVDVTLIADSGFDLPTTITVTVDSSPLTVVDDYSYNVSTGAIHIPGTNVTGAVAITAAGEAQGG